MMFKHEMGTEVRDTVTGIQGFITSRHEYISGCLQYGVEAKAKDNESKIKHFDEDRLEKVSDGVTLKVKTAGGPQRTPPSRR